MKSNTHKIGILMLLAGVAVFLALPALATDPEPDNLAPIAENLELSTYRDIGLSGTLLAIDPEGDFLDFQIVKSPKKGEVELDETSGIFTYMPFTGKKGKDTFTYVAVDAVGNISQEATVVIRIEKQARSVAYSDMEGHPAHSAAVSLVEQDIFIGEQIGGRYFFNPTRTVSRGEFLAMCLRLTDTELLSGIVRTGFADDAELEDWLKPYVSTALMEGVIQGYPTSSGTVFKGSAEIRMGEAAVMLSNLLGLADTPTAGAPLEARSAPAWAYQAAVNLNACNIASFDGENAYERAVTRAEAAEMLENAAALLENRPGAARSLLSWAA